MQCATCGQPFYGRPNRRYCSQRCLKRLAYLRRMWDARVRLLNSPDFASTMFGRLLTGEARQQAERWRQDQLSQLGERP